MTSDALVHHELSHQEVHAASVGLLTFLNDNEVSPELGIAAMAMSIGRLISPVMMEAKEEKRFVESLSEFLSLYFMTGTVN